MVLVADHCVLLFVFVMIWFQETVVCLTFLEKHSETDQELESAVTFTRQRRASSFGSVKDFEFITSVQEAAEEEEAALAQAEIMARHEDTLNTKGNRNSTDALDLIISGMADSPKMNGGSTQEENFNELRVRRACLKAMIGICYFFTLLCVGLIDYGCDIET